MSVSFFKAELSALQIIISSRLQPFSVITVILKFVACDNEMFEARLMITGYADINGVAISESNLITVNAMYLYCMLPLQ